MKISVKSILPVLGIVSLILLALLILHMQWKQTYRWDEVFVPLQTFGKDCEQTASVWQDGDSFQKHFESLGSRSFSPLPLPLKFGDPSLLPAIPSNGVLISKCVIDPTKLSRTGFGQARLGRLYGDAAVYVNGTLRLTQNDNGEAIFPLLPADRTGPMELVIIARRTSENSYPGLGTSLPPAISDDRDKVGAIDGIFRYFFVEGPLFRMGFGLALTLVFVCSWIMGIRYEDVGWTIVAGAFLTWNQFFRLSPTLNPTALETSLFYITQFGVYLAFVVFMLKFFRVEAGRWLHELSFVVLLAAYAVTTFMAPSELRKVLQLREGLPAFLAGAGISFAIWKGSKVLSQVSGGRRVRLYVAISSGVAAALACFFQGISASMMDLDFQAFLTQGLLTMAALFLGADLVVFHHGFFQEREIRRQEERKSQGYRERLELGRYVQELLLPKQRSGRLGPFDYQFFYEPSEEMSGDWIRICEFEGSKVLFLGDVVGKGPSAALAVSAISSVLNECETSKVDVAGAVVSLNRQLYDLFHGHITTTMVAFRLLDQQVEVFNCGTAGVFYSKSHQASVEHHPLRSHPLGIKADPTTARQVLDVADGEFVVALSDGILGDKSAYGEFERILKRHLSHATDFETVHRVALTVRGHLDRDDDKTMMILGRGVFQHKSTSDEGVGNCA